MKLKKIFLLVATVCSCQNPFFPPVGTPIVTDIPRSTPQLTIDQLLKAYENKRIDLFIDLLPKDKSFQFYVAPTFSISGTTNFTVKSQESKDPRLKNLDGDRFYYWTHDEEVKSHSEMFNRADRIEFSPRPIVDLSQFNYILDGTDTVGVEVVMNGQDLDIYIPLDQYTIQHHIVSIEKQVFLLVKDSDGLWVIRKWYDLSNAE